MNKIPRVLILVTIAVVSLARITQGACVGDQGCFVCDKDAGRCFSQSVRDGGGLNISECINSCFNGGTSQVSTTMSNTIWATALRGPCRNCTVNIFTTWSFQTMFSALSINTANMQKPACVIDSRVAIPMPKNWLLQDPSKPLHCFIGSERAKCAIQKNTIIMTVTNSLVSKELLKPSKRYRFQIAGGISSPDIPVDSTVSPFSFFFNSSGTCSDVNVNDGARQLINSKFPFSENVARTLEGTFRKVSLKVKENRILTTTKMEVSFISGSVLRAGSWFVFRSIQDNLFAKVVKDVSSAKIVSPFEASLKVFVGASNISLFIPGDFQKFVDNGEQVKIEIKNIRNPSSIRESPRDIFLLAYTEESIVMSDVKIPFYKVRQDEYSQAVNAYDITSAILFGLCSLLAGCIIHSHGLAFSRTTIWTDMVAVTALMSFLCAFVAYIFWMLSPSEAFVYFSAAQYFFNSVMLLSLCFHWASVLSLKLFKKLSLKSPVVLGYIFCNAVVAVVIVVSSTLLRHKIDCVYNENVLLCDSAELCAITPKANGHAIRQAIQVCNMYGYYLTLASLFIVYTLLLMILGCMVMCRGRSLMLVDQRDDAKIRTSLTIFYMIIATTCVLYISAQVIYILQYAFSDENLSDFVWYLFIVWLPQSLPPVLLLFLQWNPATSDTVAGDDEVSMLEAESPGKQNEYVSNITPRSSDSDSNRSFSHHKRSAAAAAAGGIIRDSVLLIQDHNDEQINKLPVVVRVKLPSSFTRACFVSLDFCSTKSIVTSEQSLRSLGRSCDWKCVGSTERVRCGSAIYNTRHENEDETEVNIPFVAVLEVPVVGKASHTVLRFMLHSAIEGASAMDARNTSEIDREDYMGGNESRSSSTVTTTNCSSDQNASLPNNNSMVMFHPLCEFVTTLQAVMDAAASGQPLCVSSTEDSTCTYLEDKSSEVLNDIDLLLNGEIGNAQLCVQTVMLPGDNNNKPDESKSHHNIGNIIRFFQYDSENGPGGLVVEDLQESNYANSIPRQLLELIAAERQEQTEKAKIDLRTFQSQKKNDKKRGFYGNLIGKIQDEGDSALIRDWLENRVHKRREYVNLVRKNIQLLLNRDKQKQYFKASVQKKSADLRFVPINLHVQDLLVGPTSAFVNQNEPRVSKSVSTYELTSVGAFAAHVYKFNKGGILSMQTKLQKTREKINDKDAESGKWPEELREYDDSVWDVQLRMDVCFSQALSSLVAAFSRKVEIALQHPDTLMGEGILRQLSTLGYLYQVESLLSTHGKEIGMLEDMAAAVAQLSCVCFVIQDVSNRPTGRFSFRLPRMHNNDNSSSSNSLNSKDKQPCIVKASISEYSPATSAGDTVEFNSRRHKPVTEKMSIKYVVTLQVYCEKVSLPEHLSNGGNIYVTPVLFTQGINEMQTIANNTERAKTEIQDMININNLRPLKSYCDKYCRLAVALPPANVKGKSSTLQPLRHSGLMRLSENQVTEEFQQLQSVILDCAQSLVKVKHPEILRIASDLCREIGGSRVTICKSAKDRTAMSVTLEQCRILHRHHDLPVARIPATVAVMRTHGVRIENALKNTGKRQFAFNKFQKSLLPEEYRCPDTVGGVGNVS